MTRPRVFTSFDDAQGQRTDTQTVCGVITHDGAPAYFLMDAEADQGEVQSTAFQIREGRPMGDSERTFIAAVHRHAQRA